MDLGGFKRGSEAVSRWSVTGALSGCLYAAFVVAISVGLLFLNALLCLTVYASIPKPDSASMARVGQLFFFIAPALLLLVEWNLLDRLQRLFRI